MDLVHAAEEQRGHAFFSGLGVDFVRVGSGDCHLPDRFGQHEQLSDCCAALVARKTAFRAAPAVIDLGQLIQPGQGSYRSRCLGIRLVRLFAVAAY